MTFRLCIVSELAGAVIFIFMALALCRLMHEVDRTQAGLMVILVLLSVPITFVNVLNETAALTLLHGASFLAGVDPGQRQTWGCCCLELHSDGANLANVFWGLRLFPFGYLVVKSTFIPKILGIWIVANGLALVAVSLTSLLAPWAWIWWTGLPWCRSSAMLWLIIRGVKAVPAGAAA